jgi:sporulation protein YlmC with PRC-barrel domain
MTGRGPLKLVSELLDLPLLDSEGKYCGIVDDVEIDGAAGKQAKLKALLVGPGAYKGRLPKWAMWLVAKVAGEAIVRVPIARVKSIAATVKLDCPASELGLDKSERRAMQWIPKGGAL